MPNDQSVPRPPGARPVVKHLVGVVSRFDEDQGCNVFTAKCEAGDFQGETRKRYETALEEARTHEGQAKQETA